MPDAVLGSQNIILINSKQFLLLLSAKKQGCVTGSPGVFWEGLSELRDPAIRRRQAWESLGEKHSRQNQPQGKGPEVGGKERSGCLGIARPDCHPVGSPGAFCGFSVVWALGCVPCPPSSAAPGYHRGSVLPARCPSCSRPRPPASPATLWTPCPQPPCYCRPAPLSSAPRVLFLRAILSKQGENLLDLNFGFTDRVPEKHVAGQIQEGPHLQSSRLSPAPQYRHPITEASKCLALSCPPQMGR